MFRLFLILLLLFPFKQISFAQVATQDSLVLVSLYNNNGGVSWNNKTNWLTTNVNQWYGVLVSGGRVRSLSLSNNNLTGTLPYELCDLTQLNYLVLSNNQLGGTMPPCFVNMTALVTIDFRNNNFTGSIPAGITAFPNLADVMLSQNDFDELPDLSGVFDITNILIEGNRFTFEDIENNTSVVGLNYVYAPQDSIGIFLDTIVDIHTPFSFSRSSGGNNNTYQWKKDNVVLTNQGVVSGTQTAMIVNNSAELSDSGVYILETKNALAPVLTLYSRKIVIHINDTRLPQEINFVSGANFFCGDAPSNLPATTSVGLPITYTVLSGNANVSGNVVTPLSTGTIVLSASHPGDMTYRPVSKDTTIQILIPSYLPGFSVSANSPVKLDSTLVISVQNISGLIYSWETPGGTYTTPEVIVSPFAETDQGNYIIAISENSCVHFKDTVEVKLWRATDVIVYEFISPDGDGKNEFFCIENIQYFPENEVIVFNSFNQEVFQEKAYHNTWTGDSLPAGTYYYLVKIQALNKTYKGALYLKR